MIGNDIVDLKVAATESNWRRKGFLEKLFSKEECEFLFDSRDPDIFVWLLWAMKESSYKAHQRKFKLPRKFNPKDFCCKISDTSSSLVPGEVSIGDQIYFTNSSIKKQHIYCYARSGKNLMINQKIFINSIDIKEELVSNFSRLYNLPKENIFIKKNNRSIPSIFYEKREINCNLSLTHHGNFSAYIFELINL